MSSPCHRVLLLPAACPVRPSVLLLCSAGCCCCLLCVSRALFRVGCLLCPSASTVSPVHLSSSGDLRSVHSTGGCQLDGGRGDEPGTADTVTVAPARPLSEGGTRTSRDEADEAAEATRQRTHTGGRGKTTRADTEAWCVSACGRSRFLPRSRPRLPLLPFPLDGAAPKQRSAPCCCCCCSSHLHR